MVSLEEKISKLNALLTQQEVKDILKTTLDKQQLESIARKSPVLSQIPKELRTVVIKKLLENKGFVKDQELKKGTFDTLLDLLSFELYNQRPPEDQFLRNLIILNEQTGGMIASINISMVSLNVYRLFSDVAMKVLDKANQRYVGEVGQTSYAGLRLKLLNPENLARMKESGELHSWIYALANSTSVAKNILTTEIKVRVGDKKQELIAITMEGYNNFKNELVEELECLERRRIDLEQQLIGLKDQLGDKIVESRNAESARQKLNDQYKALEQKYKALEVEKQALQLRIKELEQRPQGDVGELTSRITTLEAEKDNYRRQTEENVELADSYLKDMESERQSHDKECRRLQARIQGLTRLLERRNGANGNNLAEETIEERFADQGFDYELINAIVVGGSQNLVRRGGSLLSRTSWRKNTQGKLDDKSKIDGFDETVEMLVRQGVLISIGGRNDAFSVSTSPDKVDNPVLRNYLSDVLRDPIKYRS